MAEQTLLDDYEWSLPEVLVILFVIGVIAFGIITVVSVAGRVMECAP